jgi:hypothetical protein
VYFRLTEAVKRRFIEELRRFWAYHPRYPDLVGNIQGKFSFNEQPQFGIIVKNGGGSHVALSADNYVGVIQSYVYKTLVQNYPGVFLEWVREEAVAIQNNGGRFPSPPGVYYLEITAEDEFYVDPLYDAYNEQVMVVDEYTIQLAHPFLKGSLRLYEQPNGFLLQEGANFQTGEPDEKGHVPATVTLTKPLTGNRYLVADYRWPGESIGPVKYRPMFANKDVIPGVVLAFGRRCKVGDRAAVVVQDRRKPAAMAYGGRWELSLDFDVMARDVYSQQEIHDFSVMYLWGVLRNRLSSEGIEIKDVSLGGESEEPYDENADDYFYNATFSMTVETDWEIHVPLNALMRMVAPLTLEQAGIIANQDEPTDTGNIQGMEALGLLEWTDPFFHSRGHTYELIR